MSRPYHGPYQVIEVHDNDAYVRHVDTTQEEPLLVAIQQLKQCLWRYQMNSGPLTNRQRGASLTPTEKLKRHDTGSEVTDTPDAPQQRHGQTSNTESTCAGECTSDHEDTLSEKLPPVRPAIKASTTGYSEVPRGRLTVRRGICNMVRLNYALNMYIICAIISYHYSLMSSFLWHSTLPVTELF